MTPEQIDIALEECRKQLFPDEQTKSSTSDVLNLLPLDHIMHIVLTVCVPFFTKVASETLYNAYKTARDSSKLKHAVQEVKENAVSVQVARLDDPALSAEVKKRLIDNGFTDERAEMLVPELFNILRNASQTRPALGTATSR
jgi:hypothetical protein